MNFQIIDLKEKLLAAAIVALNSDFCRGAAARAFGATLCEPGAREWLQLQEIAGGSAARALCGRCAHTFCGRGDRRARGRPTRQQHKCE